MRKPARSAPRPLPVVPVSFALIALIATVFFILPRLASTPSPLAPTPKPRSTAAPTPTAGEEAPQVEFGPAPGASGYEVDTFLTVEARIPQLQVGGASYEAQSVQLLLLDEAGKPAPFGKGAGSPVQLFPRYLGADLKPSWGADLSVPSRAGVYHAQLIVGTTGIATRTLEVATPTLAAVEAMGRTEDGFLYTLNGNLWLTSSDGTHTHRLTFYPYEREASEPSWSADGSQIAYAQGVPVPGDQYPTSDIWVLDPRSGEDKPVVLHHDGEGLSSPAWSPNGHLLFTSDEFIDPQTGATPTIERMAEGREVWSIDSFDPTSGVRSRILADADRPDISRDGSLLAYVGLNYMEDQSATGTSIMIAAADGSSPRVLVTPEQFLAVDRPRISPDGRSVAFAAVINFDDEGVGDIWKGLREALLPRAYANGVPWDVYQVPVGGGEPERLTQMYADQPALSWGRDATRLGVMSGGGIFIVAPDGTAQFIAAGQTHGYISWYDR